MVVGLLCFIVFIIVSIKNKNSLLIKNCYIRFIFKKCSVINGRIIIKMCDIFEVYLGYFFFIISKMNF